MRRVKQASRKKRTTKVAAVTVLGAAGLGLSLFGSASGSTMPAADIPQSDTTSPNQRVVLGEEEMQDVSLATFHLFDRENVGGGIQLARGGCGGCGGCGHGGGGGCACGHGGGGFGGCAHAGFGGCAHAGFGGCGRAGFGGCGRVGFVGCRGCGAFRGCRGFRACGCGGCGFVDFGFGDDFWFDGGGPAAYPGARAACAKSHDLSAHRA
jgi:hypothetical protein